MEKSDNNSDNYCDAIKQKELVSKMTECDNKSDGHAETVECYQKETKKSREDKACMYS